MLFLPQAKVRREYYGLLEEKRLKEEEKQREEEAKRLKKEARAARKAREQMLERSEKHGTCNGKTHALRLEHL